MNRLFAFAVVGFLSLFATMGALAEGNSLLSTEDQRIKAQDPVPSEKIRTMTGEIEAIDTDQKLLVVKNRRWEKGFFYDDETQVKEGRRFLNQEDLKLGMRVKVAYQEIDGKIMTHLVRLKK